VQVAAKNEDEYNGYSDLEVGYDQDSVEAMHREESNSENRSEVCT
jgi:hypothetical protein